MNKLSIGPLLFLLAGCTLSMSLKMDFSSPVKEGELVELVEIANPKAQGFEIQIWNLGPERGPGGESLLEIRNGDQVLGRIETGEIATYTVPGAGVRLKVRALKGDTRFKGFVDVNAR